MVKIKILFIAHQVNIHGGASRSMLSIIFGLKERYGCEPVVLLPGEGELSHVLSESNVEYIVCPYYWWMGKKNTLMDTLTWSIRIAYNFFMTKVIFSRLRGYGFNLVYTNTSVIGIGFDIASYFRLPHIYHVREFGQEDHGIWYIQSIHKITRKIKSNRTRVITISDSLKEKYKRVFGVESMRVYNGVEDFCGEKKIRESNRDVVFVVIGYICDGKNQLEILRAVDEVKKRGIDNFRVVFIGGGDDDYLYRVDSLVRECGIISNVEFKGEMGLEKVYDYISTFADSGIIASKKEAFGRVTVEYMLASLPVIAAKSGASPEVLGGDYCLLYDSGNVDELAEKMIMIISDSDLRHQIGSASRQRALERFSISATVDNVFNIVKCAVDKSHF